MGRTRMTPGPLWPVALAGLGLLMARDSLAGGEAVPLPEGASPAWAGGRSRSWLSRPMARGWPWAASTASGSGTGEPAPTSPGWRGPRRGSAFWPSPRTGRPWPAAARAAGSGCGTWPPDAARTACWRGTRGWWSPWPSLRTARSWRRPAARTRRSGCGPWRPSGPRRSSRGICGTSSPWPSPRTGRRWRAAAPTAPIRLWSVDGALHIDTFEGLGTWVQALAFSPDGSMLASGGRNGEVRLWDVAAGGHQGPATSPRGHGLLPGLLAGRGHVGQRRRRHRGPVVGRRQRPARGCLQG